MNQAIVDFMQAKRIAVLGASRSGEKFGNKAYQALKERGYQLFLVHPNAQEIAGERCYPSLQALRGQVDGAWICLQPQHAQEALRDAAGAGVSRVWLQPGAESLEVLALARELGIEPISGKCILMYAQPVRSYHAWHRGFSRIFGKL